MKKSERPAGSNAVYLRGAFYAFFFVYVYLRFYLRFQVLIWKQAEDSSFLACKYQLAIETN